MQVGDANGGRAHIDATAVLPEIERRADDGDVGTGHLLHCTDGVLGTVRGMTERGAFALDRHLEAYG